MSEPEGVRSASCSAFEWDDPVYVARRKKRDLIADLATFVRDAAPEIENEADLRSQAGGTKALVDTYVRPMRELSDRANALILRLGDLEVE